MAGNAWPVQRTQRESNRCLSPTMFMVFDDPDFLLRPWSGYYAVGAGRPLLLSCSFLKDFPSSMVYLSLIVMWDCCVRWLIVLHLMGISAPPKKCSPSPFPQKFPADTLPAPRHPPCLSWQPPPPLGSFMKNRPPSWRLGPFPFPEQEKLKKDPKRPPSISSYLYPDAGLRFAPCLTTLARRASLDRPMIC